MFMPFTKVSLHVCAPRFAPQSVSSAPSLMHTKLGCRLVDLPRKPSHYIRRTASKTNCAGGSYECVQQSIAASIPAPFPTPNLRPRPQVPRTCKLCAASCL